MHPRYKASRVPRDLQCGQRPVPSSSFDKLVETLCISRAQFLWNDRWTGLCTGSADAFLTRQHFLFGINALARMPSRYQQTYSRNL